jgi:HD-GYP domain-containing protein (c-di-GMP phosphodiesterase class II)
VALMHLAITQFIRRTTGYVDELRRLNRQLSDSYESTLQALSRALDTRDAETEEHSQRVKRYTELIGRRFGLPDEEIAHLCRGAMLHDIGKIGVPDAILLKPAPLSASEIEAMRKHPTIGYTMIAHIPFLAKAAEIVLYHHESYDGTGYPSRLAGEEIPLGARIFAVVDTLDAMTSDRPYRKAVTFEEALAEIQRERGRQFDPVIVDSLLAVSISELVRCRDDARWETAPDEQLQSAPSLSAAPA